MKGKVHLYERDHINTDEIIPARYLSMDTEEELAEHAMEGLDRTFTEKVSTGDFIAAGNDFGCGSSREHAVWALRGAGIRAVIAESFARIFFRNCINSGMLIIECQGISKKLSDEDELEIDITGRIQNLTENKMYKFTPLPEFARAIIEAGGLMNYIKEVQK